MAAAVENLEFVTFGQAAAIAGRSRALIDMWSLRGAYGIEPLPVVKFGHARLIRRVDLDAFLVEYNQKTDGRTKRHDAD